MIAISRFKATCLAAVDRVSKTGRHLIITKHGKPVARVIPEEPPPRAGSGFGAMAGTIEFLGDIEGPFPEEWYLDDAANAADDG